MPTPVLVKIPELDAISAGSINAATDLFVIVDVSDTTRDALGTPKKTTIADIATKIDHSWLAGIVSDQHVAHSGVSITAGTGLSGGGTIASTRTLNLNLTGLDAITTIEPDDLLAVSTDSDGTPKKITWTDFLAELNAEGVGGGSLEIGVTDFVGGTSGNILFHNGLVLGEKGTTGTGNVVLVTGPTIVGPTFTGGMTAGGTLLFSGATMALYAPTAAVSTPFATFAQEWDNGAEVFVGATTNIVGTDYDASSVIEVWNFNSSPVVSIGVSGDITSTGVVTADGLISTADLTAPGTVTLGSYDVGTNTATDIVLDGDVTIGHFDGVWGNGSGSIGFAGQYGAAQWIQGGNGVWRLSSPLGTGGGIFSIDTGGSATVLLQNGNANYQLWLRDGVQAQKFAIASTFTDFNDYSVLFLDAQTHPGEFWINSDNSTSGTVLPLVLATGDTERLRITAAGVTTFAGAVGFGGAAYNVPFVHTWSGLAGLASGSQYYLQLMANGTEYAVLSTNNFSVGGSHGLGFTSGNNVGNDNFQTGWHQESNGLIGQYGTGGDIATAQGRTIYNTRTNSSNYERALLAWVSNEFRIGTEKLGTGSARPLVFLYDGVEKARITSSGLIESAPYNVGNISGTTTLAYTNGKFQKMALTGTTTLAVPTGGAEGYVMRLFITASGANRDLSMNASIKVPDESLLTWPKTLTSAKTYIAQLQHNGTDWLLLSFVGGY